MILFLIAKIPIFYRVSKMKGFLLLLGLVTLVSSQGPDAFCLGTNLQAQATCLAALTDINVSLYYASRLHM